MKSQFEVWGAAGITTVGSGGMVPSKVHPR